MTEERLNVLINRIAEEVLYRINKAAPKDEEVTGTVGIVTSYIPSLKTALKTIEEKYNQIEYIADGTEFSAFGRQCLQVDEENRQEVIQKVASSANVVLITPKISLLAKIAEGEDEGYIEYLITRALLWGRNVEVLLDFTPPRFKRNTFFEKIITILETLEEMGVKVVSYKCSEQDDSNRYSLVTETEVLSTYKAGKKEVMCAPGAIVTPSAKDKAKELEIAINY